MIAFKDEVAVDIFLSPMEDAAIIIRQEGYGAPADALDLMRAKIREIVAENERLLEVIESQKDIIWGLKEQLAGNIGHR